MLIYSRRLPWLMAGVLIFLFSCRNETPESDRAEVAVESRDGVFDLEALSGLLRSSLPAVDTTDSLYRSIGFREPQQVLRLVYQRCDYQPLWITKGGVATAAADCIEALDSLRFDGIPTRRYGVDTLRLRLAALKPESPAGALLQFDTALTLAWLRAASDLHFGLLRPRRADSLWFHANDSSWNAATILAGEWFENGSAPELHRFRSGIPLYGQLRGRYRELLELSANPGFNDVRLSLEAGSDSLARVMIRGLLSASALTNAHPDSLIRAYQYAYGLTQNNRLDSATLASLRQPVDTLAMKLAANMERLRWLPQQLEARHLFVDIPLMELGVQDAGQETLRMRVVVGKSSRQTPSLGARMTNIVFSPAWSVPPTILKKDVLPGLSSRGAGYLRRKGLRVFDRKGRPVDAGAVTGSNYRNYVYRQPPGARNALGEVKFNLPNGWDIYLHDTPHREDFVKRYRALSSGCIRLHDPKGLAAFILNDLEGKSKYTPGAIDSIISTRKSRWVMLDQAIPVHIVYLTAASDSSGLRLLPDIYRKDGKLLRKLAEIQGAI
jgi:murein L,D-transpeptidase YcbB/YkuD